MILLIPFVKDEKCVTVHLILIINYLLINYSPYPVFYKKYHVKIVKLAENYFHNYSPVKSYYSVLY